MISWYFQALVLGCHHQGTENGLAFFFRLGQIGSLYIWLHTQYVLLTWAVIRLGIGPPVFSFSFKRGLSKNEHWEWRGRCYNDCRSSQSRLKGNVGLRCIMLHIMPTLSLASDAMAPSRSAARLLLFSRWKAADLWSIHYSRTGCIWTLLRLAAQIMTKQPYDDWLSQFFSNPPIGFPEIRERSHSRSLQIS